MPSTYTLNNGIELIGTGEQSGTWGDTTNTNLELLDTALDGQVTVTLASAGTSGSPNTLPISDGAASDGRNRMVIFDDSSDLGATAYVQLTPNDAEKIIYIRNSLSGGRDIIMFQGTYSSSNDYIVPNGTTAVVYFDGGGAGAVAANVLSKLQVEALNVESDAATTAITIDNTATDGDPILRFALSGTNTFTMGIDDGDSDKFKIGTSAIGTNTRLTITSSGAVGIGEDSPVVPLHLKTSSSGEAVRIESTDASGAVGPLLSLYRNSASPVPGDNLGQVLFYGEDDGSNITTYAAIESEIYGATDGSESGRLHLKTMFGGTLTSRFYMNHGETVVNESGASLDFRAESSNNTHMLFVDASADKVNIGSSASFSGMFNVDLNASGVIAHFEGASSNHLRISENSNTMELNANNGAAAIALQSNGNERFRTEPTVVVVNEDGADVDFRVESASSPYAFLVDAGNDEVLTQSTGGFVAENGTVFNHVGLTLRNTGSSVSSSHKAQIDFEVNGTGGVVNRAQISGGKTSSASTTGYLRFDVLDAGTMETRLTLEPDEVILNENSYDVDFRVESDGKSHMLFVDAGNNVVSINNAENQSAFVLNVVGTNVSGGRVAKLAGGDVNTATSTSAPHLVIENNNSTTGNFSALAFASSNGGTTAFIGAKNTNHTTHSGDLYIATRGPANGYLNKVFIGDSSMVINESGVAYTFRVESDINSHALYVEPTNSRVGINNSTPSEQLTVNGSALFQEAEAEVRIYNNGSDPAEWRLMSSSNAGATAAFRIYNQTTTSNNFWIAGSTNAGNRAGNVGINNTNPQGILHLDQGTDQNGIILAYSGRGTQRHQWELSGVNNENSAFIQYNGTDRHVMAIMGRSSFTVNEDGISQDFRVESDSQSHMLWVDAGSNVLHMGGYVTAGQDGARIMFNGNKGYQGTGVANDMLNIRDTTSHGTTDNGGAIVFSGQYASGSYTSFAEIHGIKTNNTSSSYDGDLLFKRRLNGGSMYTQGMSQYGYLKWANDGVSNHTYHDSNTHSFSTDKNFASVSMGSTNLAMTRRVLITATKQSSSSSYYQIESWSGDGTNVYTDREFGLRGDGNAYADGSWNGGGADYAEYFEWADGNTANEDRRGYSVVLENNMMRKATSSDDVSKIIGVISGSPAVVGDHAENRWADKFVKDDFGSIVWDEHEVWEWEETYTDDDGVEQTRKVSYESWSIPSDITPPADKTVLTHDENGNPFKHRRLNPTFDPDVEYIPRSERPEWDCVGLMGKLRLRKGQPTGANWIKMRDISADVEEWLVR